MILEKNHIYHIYNQGNNRQKIFFARNNYLYFLEKFNKLVSPYVDVIAWCLMPNHFHFMLYVKEIELEIIESEDFTQSETLTKEKKALTKKRTLNDSIGVLLRSYTRAINKQENMSGSLFRNPTRSECVTRFEGISPSYFNTSSGTQINVRIPEKEYPQACFDYIHYNPVVANIVKKLEDWEYSSYRDYCGLRNGKMVNKQRAEEYVNFS
jgi:putative transposase